MKNFSKLNYQELLSTARKQDKLIIELFTLIAIMAVFTAVAIIIKAN